MSFWLARQSQSHNAYVFERVTVHYRWLALHGASLECQRRVSLPDSEYLHCELPDGALGAIPVWMTDPVACAEFSFGEPRVSVEALMSLRDLLDSLAFGSPRRAREGEAGANGAAKEAAADSKENSSAGRVLDARKDRRT